MVLISLGEHEQAARSLYASLHFVEETGNERGQASVLFHLGRLEMSRGDPAAAAGFYQRCLTVAQRTNDHEVLCWSHCMLGEVLRALDKQDLALTHLHQGQFHAQYIGDRSAQAAALTQIAAIYRDRGEHQTATGYCEDALAEVEAVPDLAVALKIHTTLAEIDLARGEPESALRHASFALEMCRQTHDAMANAHAFSVMGNVSAALDDLSGAIEAWRGAEELYTRVENGTLANMLRAQIRAASASEDSDPAM